MPSLNQVHLAGHLGRDAETKQGNGWTLTTFNLAVSCGTKEKPKTAWIEIKVWNASAAVQELQKGAAVMIEGRIEQESWEKNGQKQSKLVIVAQIVSKPLYEPKGKSAANPPAAQQGSWEVTDEDVPF